jgi:hypothetical protein
MQNKLRGHDPRYCEHEAGMSFTKRSFVMVLMESVSKRK